MSSTAQSLFTVKKTSHTPALFATAGTYEWQVPDGVTSICAVCIEGGTGGSARKGGNGGRLSYANHIPVTPGETLTVVVGIGGAATNSTSTTIRTTIEENASYILRDSTVLVRAGYTGTSVGTFTSSGGIGGSGASATLKSPYNGATWTGYHGGGGGGAGGYAGTGGNGAATIAAGGSGGAGGGGGRHTWNTTSMQYDTGYGGQGGGVGPYGQGVSGAGGKNVTVADTYGNPYGGGGSDGSYNFGSGGGAGNTFLSAGNTVIPQFGFAGGGGCVRIIYGPGREFPSTNTADE